MLLLTCRAFFGRGDADFSTDWIEFWFRVVGVNPGFVTGNDIGMKAGVVSRMFLEVDANVSSLLFLVNTEETGHELGCDTSHLQTLC